MTKIMQEGGEDGVYSVRLGTLRPALIVIRKRIYLFMAGGTFISPER